MWENGSRIATHAHQTQAFSLVGSNALAAKGNMPAKVCSSSTNEVSDDLPTRSKDVHFPVTRTNLISPPGLGPFLLLRIG